MPQGPADGDDEFDEPARYGRYRLRREARQVLVGLAVLALLTVLAAVAMGWRSPEFLLFEACAVGLLLLVFRLVDARFERMEQGNNGELKVAEAIQASAEDGWLCLHDVPTGRGNIDHVLVGPAGVLTVETKSRKGRVNVDNLDRAWLNQAWAQSKHLERTTGHKADPLLVFSDAYLAPRPVSRHRGVCVLPARMLRGHLARRPPVLSGDEVSALHAELVRTFSS